MKDKVTNNTIKNIVSNNYYPAAGTCYVYTTEGTKVGDWYLPSLAELALIMGRYSQIKQSLLAVGGQDLDNRSLYSSTQDDSPDYKHLVWYLYTANGGFNEHNKLYKHYVRPFIQL